jgi:hypothetical protein
VFENRVLMGMLRRIKGKVTGGWRKLHNEELHISRSSIISLIKKRRLSWIEHVARVVEKGGNGSGRKNSRKETATKP